jgi:hypothetical protein
MPRKYKKEQEKITFDAMMEILSEKLWQLPDQRRANRSYELLSIVKSPSCE